MLVVRGADKRNLQASIFGGAVNSEATNYTVGTSEQNVAVGLEILEKMSVEVICNNTGGSRARKIVFDSATGETVMAVVDSVRDTDWYPSVPEVNKIT
jgi:chemotaxis protein CheD